MSRRTMKVVTAALVILLSSCKPPERLIENPVNNRSDICQGCFEPGTSQGKDLKELIIKGNVADARKSLCEYNKKTDCLKAIVNDETKKNDVTLNQMVVVIDTLILLQKVDDAINRASSLSGTLGSPKLLPLQATSCGLDAVDTILQFIGLDKDTVKQYALEIDGAVENIERNPDRGKIKLVVSFSVNLGSETEKPLLQASFKDVVIDYDEVVLLGAVSKLLLAAFKVIDSHDFRIDIGKVLQNENVSELLNDLKSDFIGLIRRLPKTLDLNTCTNFLKFVEGGGDIWKSIPDDLIVVLSRFKNGVEFLFSKDNWCSKEEKDLLCFFDGNKDGKVSGYGKLSKQQEENAKSTCDGGQADCLLFKFESAKMGGELEDGYIVVPNQFNLDTFESLLVKFSQKTNCSQTDNVLEIKDASDILKQFGIIDYDIPNFAQIDVCKLFGSKGAKPKSLRDMVFPIEINTYDGFSFQFEIEVPEGTTQVVTFQPGTARSYPEFALEEWVGKGKIIIYAPVTDISFSIETTTVLTIETTDYSVRVTAPKGVTYEVQPSQTTQVVLPIEFVKPYIRNGDSEHFENTKKLTANKRDIDRDFASPLTDILTSKGYKYPADVFTLSTDDISKTLSYIGNTFIMYTAMKDPSFNGSLKLNICPIIEEISNQASERKDKNKITEKQRSKIDEIVTDIKARYNTCPSSKFEDSNQQMLSDLMAHLQFLAALAEVFAPEALPQM